MNGHLRMKYPIKMIVSDLDGTLLRTDQSISDETKSVLRRCRESGIKAVYATGRGATADFAAPADLFDGRIIMNGAVAFAGETVVYRRAIPYDIARPLLIACDRHGLRTVSECDDMHYANFAVSAVWPEITNYRIVDFASHAMDAEKLYATIRNPADIALIQKHLPDTLYMTVSRDDLAMIMHRDATKSKALAELARRFHVAPPQIAAFGDDRNDIDMLSFAGIGVAMENALDEAKAAADCICGRNDEDGVAKWIVGNLL